MGGFVVGFELGGFVGARWGGASEYPTNIPQSKMGLSNKKAGQQLNKPLTCCFVVVTPGGFEPSTPGLGK